MEIKIKKLQKISYWKSISEYKFEKLVIDNSKEEFLLKFKHFSIFEALKSIFLRDDYWFMKIFVRELARRNSWKQSYAKRVTAEYKKFLYLYCVTDGKVTPSVTVDKAWHLHLEFRNGYKFLEDDVVMRPLIHKTDLADLKLSKDEELVFFEEQYMRTLDLYIYEFNQSPPNDIWKSIIEEEDVQSVFIKRDRTDDSYTDNVRLNRERQKETVKYFHLDNDEPIYIQLQLDIDEGDDTDPFSHEILSPVNVTDTIDAGGNNSGAQSESVVGNSNGDGPSVEADSGPSTCGGSSCGGD